MLNISGVLYNRIISVITILLTTAIISFTLTFLNNEQKTFPFYAWLETWKLVFLLAYLISLFLPGFIKKSASFIFKIKDQDE